MNHLPKFKDFDAPKGYFDRLPDEILRKADHKTSYSWTKYAAAAIILMGLAVFWQLDRTNPEDRLLTTEEEANLYIESQLWTAEDVLSFSDNPNELLDQIIEEELTASGELWTEEELNWF